MAKNIRTVLIIDDDQNIRGFIESFLAEENYRVFTACNGIEAAEIFKKYRFDIVITDMVMPQRGGVHAIMNLKGINPEIKIIAMSGADNKERFFQSAKAFGADDAIAKPFKPDDLLIKIDQLLIS
jgi:two-component system response regulator (stage 0 sporulation protein F)